MKARVYLRIAESERAGHKFVVDAKSKPHYGALLDRFGDPRPTAAFALDIDLPDKAFRMAEQAIAEVELPEDKLDIVAEVRLA